MWPRGDGDTCRSASGDACAETKCPRCSAHRADGDAALSNVSPNGKRSVPQHDLAEVFQ